MIAIPMLADADDLGTLERERLDERVESTLGELDRLAFVARGPRR